MGDESSGHLRSTGGVGLGRDSTGQTDHLTGMRLANRYLVDRLLDRGSFGSVYSGIDIRFSEVAIKLLTPPFSDDEFRREAQLAREFEHPNVVKVYDYGIDRGYAFIVMEFLHGDRVDHLFRSRFDRSFPLDLLDKFVYEITSALQNAHRRALIHRDLKPQNVMLIDEGEQTERFVLLDFGIAAKTDATNTLRNETRDAAHTPSYASPEQINGELTDYQSDIYSFGTILYELVTGCLPFKKKTEMLLANAVKNDPPPPFEEIEPPVKDGRQQLETLIMRCLEKDPADRPQSMEELRKEYFEARQVQYPNTARFDNHWNDDETEITVDMPPYEIGDAEQTINPTTDTDGDPWAPEIQQSEGRQVPKRKFLSHRFQLLLSVIVAVGVIAAARLSPWWDTKVEPLVTTWRPQGFEQHGKAELQQIVVDGRRANVYEMIERTVPGGEDRVVFILVNDRKSQSEPFYIMQTEVWNGLFRHFADQRPELIDSEEKGGLGIWEKGVYIEGESQGVANRLHPVVNVSPREADKCAFWLGEGVRGRLPTVVEWNTAAGFYRWQASNSPTYRTKHPGPFNGIWHFVDNSANTAKERAKNPDIAVRGDLSEVGKAKDDYVFLDERLKIHHMAGNVVEITQSLPGGIHNLRNRTANPSTSVILCGNCYNDNAPPLYTTDAPYPPTRPFNVHSPYTGFRVVIEIDLSAE